MLIFLRERQALLILDIISESGDRERRTALRGPLGLSIDQMLKRICPLRISGEHLFAVPPTCSSERSSSSQSSNWVMSNLSAIY